MHLLGAPSQVPGKKFALGSVVLLAIVLVGGFLAVATPLEELRRVFRLGGFGDLDSVRLVVLGCAAILSYLFFALFLRSGPFLSP